MTKLFFRYLCLIIVVGIVVVACHKEKKKESVVLRPVKSIVVKGPQSNTKRNFPGEILAGKITKLSFEVTGRLIQLPIKEGNDVVEGQLIAKIDPKIYEEKVGETHANYLKNLANYQRAEKLVKDGFVSVAQFDAAKANYKVAAANYETAKHDLENTVLKAPFDGVIAKKYVENFEYIKARQPIADLHNNANVDVEINVPENIMINLQRDQSHRDNDHHPVAIFNSRPTQKYPLLFKEITTKADPQTQTYRVVFTMKRPSDLNVLPGMNVNVEVTIPDYNESTDKFYLIPSAAVFTNKEKKPMVWVVNMTTMTVSPVAVTVSRLSSNEIKVLSGIKPGDRIVTAGAHYLKANQKVKLLDSSTQTD